MDSGFGIGDSLWIHEQQQVQNASMLLSSDSRNLANYVVHGSFPVQFLYGGHSAQTDLKRFVDR